MAGKRRNYRNHMKGVLMGKVPRGEGRRGEGGTEKGQPHRWWKVGRSREGEGGREERERRGSGEARRGRQAGERPE